MRSRARHVAIAGAGIAGLTAAIAFARRGFDVRIFERAASIEEVGAGLQISPNATRILARLDVLDTLAPMAVKPDAVVLHKARTLEAVAALPLGAQAEERWGAPYLTVRRTDLHGALLSAAQRLSNVAVETGSTVTHADLGDESTTISVNREDGEEEVRCDIAIAADGVWSTLRARTGAGHPSIYTGNLAWRATVPTDVLPDQSGVGAVAIRTYMHPKFHLVAYPVRGGVTTNLVAVTKGPTEAERWSNSSDMRILEAAMEDAHATLRAIIRRGAPWTTWPLHDVSAETAWTHPAGFALIGDAAHALSPFAAQGAAMAIEDAETLACVVERQPDDIAAALATYDRLRRSRVRRVKARGAFNKFAWHAAGPVAFVRDLVLAARAPERLAADLDWLYGYDVERAVEQ